VEDSTKYSFETYAGMLDLHHSLPNSFDTLSAQAYHATLTAAISSAFTIMPF
jgi:hypothetical protein